MINYIKGDATEPVGDGTKVILHCCNSIGAWGSGFVLALSKKWPEPEKKYREWFQRDTNKPKLGDILLVGVKNDIFVCNLIGQEGVGFDKDGNPPVRYDAVNSGLKKLAKAIHTTEDDNIENTKSTMGGIKLPISVHIPYLMCCDRAGGDWRIIEAIINSTLVDSNIPVTVYDFE
jgi:hypothetical protein